MNKIKTKYSLLLVFVCLKFIYIVEIPYWVLILLDITSSPHLKKMQIFSVEEIRLVTCCKTNLVCYPEFSVFM